MSGMEGGALLHVYLKDLARRWQSAEVEAGFFDAEAATVASINEYGDPKSSIPPRPFMRWSIVTGKEMWVENLAARLRARETAYKALQQTGQEMVEEIQTKLQSPWLFQPNAKRTIRKKGFDLPLQETGQVLLPAVRYTVKIKR